MNVQSTLQNGGDTQAHIERCPWKLYIDGAARNNPGPAGAGIFLSSHDTVICRHGFFLGDKTNNQAEYLALLLGLFFVRQQVPISEKICVISDSQLLVRQMLGMYRVKNEGLAPLKRLAHTMLTDYSYDLIHVRREFNKEADKLANLGIERGITPPQEFINLLQSHDITC